MTNFYGYSETDETMNEIRAPEYKGDGESMARLDLC